MNTALHYYRDRWYRWLNLPRYERASDIAAKVLAVMMISGGTAIYSADDSKGTLLVMAEHGVLAQNFAIVTVVLGLVLLFSPRVKMWGLVWRSSPMLAFILFTFIGVMEGQISIQGAVFFVLFYVIMLLLYWGAT